MATAHLTKQLLDIANLPPENIEQNEREAFVAACDKAKQALESPLEATVRFMFGAVDSVALRLAVDMGLIDHVVSNGEPVPASKLAADSGADVDLVVRIMRVLVAMSVFKEVDQHTYSANPVARTFVTGSPLREAVIHMGSQIPPVTSLPEYFAERGYKNPTDADDSPFIYTYKKTFWEWLNERPKIQSAFNTTMSIQRMNRGQEWFEFYPVKEKLQPLAPTSSTLLIDVGGNVGHDLINFQKRFPNLQGDLKFTDLSPIISQATDIPEGIQGVAHDFFTPYPPSLQGAKAYYLRNVLHDWPDKQARIILEHIRNAMTEQTILLINENALPDRNVSLYQAHLDILMMGVFASLDRTVGQFDELLDGVGLRLVKVWKSEDYGSGSGMLFEAVLKG